MQTLILIAAGVLLPLGFPTVLDEGAAANLRAGLVVCGVLALVPLPDDALRRIPDTFVSVTRP